MCDCVECRRIESSSCRIKCTRCVISRLGDDKKKEEEDEEDEEGEEREKMGFRCRAEGRRRRSRREGTRSGIEAALYGRCPSRPRSPSRARVFPSLWRTETRTIVTRSFNKNAYVRKWTRVDRTLSSTCSSSFLSSSSSSSSSPSSSSSSSLNLHALGCCRIGSVCRSRVFADDVVVVNGGSGCCSRGCDCDCSCGCDRD